MTTLSKLTQTSIAAVALLTGIGTSALGFGAGGAGSFGLGGMGGRSMMKLLAGTHQ